MPASDVYSWAKASSKPSYSWTEITNKPSTFTPSTHTHDDRYYTESEINNKLDNMFKFIQCNTVSNTIESVSINGLKFSNGNNVQPSTVGASSKWLVIGTSMTGESSIYIYSISSESKAYLQEICHSNSTNYPIYVTTASGILEVKYNSTTNNKYSVWSKLINLYHA